MIVCDDFLRKAKQVYSTFSDKSYSSVCPEMDFRECARSSYYYIFHVAKERVRKLNAHGDLNVGMHQRVINILRNSDNDSDHSLGDLLALMKVVRVQADYTLEYNFTKNEAYKVLRRAERLFEQLKKLRNEGSNESETNMKLQ